MTFPEVQFVAAPEEGAEVLFDFNDNFGDAPAAIVAKTFSLGTPSVEGDPDGLGVQYGARAVSFTLLVFGNRHAAMSTQALLARTFMLRRRGWLRVRLDEFSAPVWARTYTPTPGELDFSLIQPDSDEDAWQIEVSVAAEPYLRGQRVELWTGVINNDPGHATNPMGVTLPAVLGDAPAPLRIEAYFAHTRDFSDIAWTCSAVPAGYVPTVWQLGSSSVGGVADFWSSGTDTSAAAGATNRRITFATEAGMVERLGGTPPAIAPGRYRVSLRLGKDGSGACSYRLKLGRRGIRGNMDTAEVYAYDWADTLDAPHYVWLDMGEIDLPRPRTHADIAQPATGIPAELSLHVEKVTGGDLLLDAFRLEPVDLDSVTTLEPWEKSTTLVSEFLTAGPMAYELQVWDGDSETTLHRKSTGVLDASVSAVCRGSFPVVRPGHVNYLSVYHQARAVHPFPGTDAGDLTVSSAGVTVTYQPRHLYLGDG